MILSAAALAILLAVPCSSPSLSFREFYAAYVYRGGVGQSWMGTAGEKQSTVLSRIADAQVDWVEYRVARIEKCAAAK